MCGVLIDVWGRVITGQRGSTYPPPPHPPPQPPFIPNIDQRNASGFQDDIGDAFSDGPSDSAASPSDVEKFIDYVLNTDYGERPSESMRRSQTTQMSGRDRQMEVKRQMTGAGHPTPVEVLEEDCYEDEIVDSEDKAGA